MKRRQLSVWLVCFGLSAAVLGCEEDGMIVLMGGDKQPVAECEDGDTQCEGKNVKMCVNGKWVNEECGENGCKNGKCVECEDGETSCKDDTVAICKDGIWSKNEECGENGCENGKCVECEDGQTKCDDQKFNVCVNKTWKKKYICGECVNRQEDDGALIACECNRNLECSVEESDEKPCKLIEADDESGVSYYVDDAEQCKSNEVCSEGHCVDNSCEESPAVYVCDSDGKSYKICVNEQWEFEACASNQVCWKDGCVNCQGNDCAVLEKECHDAGDCPDNYACAGRTCVLSSAIECDEWTVRCSQDGANVERCENGRWKLAQICDQGEKCANGECVCIENETRCNTENGNHFEVCEGNVWVEKIDCGNKACVNEIDQENQMIKVCACEVGEIMCTSETETTNYKTCVSFKQIDNFNYDFSNLWGEKNSCPGNGRCVDGACREHCTGNTSKCEDNVFYQCKYGGYVPVQVCADNEQCVPGSTGNHCECINDMYKCNDQELMICDNKKWRHVETCLGDLKCNFEKGICGECRNGEYECQSDFSANRKKCVDGKLQVDDCKKDEICSALDGGACIKSKTRCEKDTSVCKSRSEVLECQNGRYGFKGKCNSSGIVCGMKENKAECVNYYKSDNKYACDDKYKEYIRCAQSGGSDAKNLKVCNDKAIWVDDRCGEGETCGYKNKTIMCIEEDDSKECTEYSYVCNDNKKKVQFCIDGKLEDFADCSEVGLRCMVDNEGQAHCGKNN